MTTWIRKPAEFDPTKSDYDNRWRDRGAVRCPTCHHAVEMEIGDTECEHCGQLFNGGGQALVPRDQWEEQYDED